MVLPPHSAFEGWSSVGRATPCPPVLRRIRYRLPTSASPLWLCVYSPLQVPRARPEDGNVGSVEYLGLCWDPKSSAREARDVGGGSLLYSSPPRPHPTPSLHPFFYSVPSFPTGSGLQVDISIAQESLSVWTGQPPWKASYIRVPPRHGPCH